MIPDIAEPAPIALDPSSNAPIFSVGQISSALKRTIEQAFSYVRVRGEISGCKRHGSGHVYLCLKDADAVLDAVMWRGTASRLDLRPEDGLEVICTGRLTIFAGRSKYQLVIERMELAGEGALLKLLEDRKRRLAEEGLFAAERKRPIPYLPGVIGVVTSPTGAVIRDILHRLDERFPRHVIVWPVAVQGNGAAQQIAAAITGFASVTPRPDLIIVARGGGSLEDLMPFNEEIVVRAAASCPIPLISAVGHETDTTLIDHAADKRAPTPTAAAEMAVPVRLELVAALAALDHRLGGAVVRLIDERRRFVEGLARGLPDPQSILNLAAQRLDDRTERLALAWETLLRDRHGRLATAAARLQHPGHRLAELQRHLRSIGERLQPAGQRLIANTAERLAGLGQVLTSLSPYRVLDRGYAVVEGPTGHPVVPENITAGMLLKLRFADALIPARALGGPKSDKAVTERSRGTKSATGRQPTLI